MHWL
ncbi:hypothetical protein YPPY64_0179, partial [Yersinia pestis PY-64]